MEEANPLATNYLVATCLLSHFGNPEVMTFRLVCSTWASAGGVILSRRDGGNARAYLRLEEEGDALRRIDRLDALLARTSSPRYLLPSAIAVSTSCIRSKSADPGATPRVQAFLKQNGEYVKGVEFFRSERRENDAEMFDEVKMILETCQNLTDLAFLPYKAKIGQTQEVCVSFFLRGFQCEVRNARNGRYKTLQESARNMCHLLTTRCTKSSSGFPPYISCRSK